MGIIRILAISAIVRPLSRVEGVRFNMTDSVYRKRSMSHWIHI